MSRCNQVAPSSAKWNALESPRETNRSAHETLVEQPDSARRPVISVRDGPLCHGAPVLLLGEKGEKRSRTALERCAPNQSPRLSPLSLSRIETGARVFLKIERRETSAPRSSAMFIIPRRAARGRARPGGDGEREKERAVTHDLSARERVSDYNRLRAPPSCCSLC